MITYLTRRAVWALLLLWIVVTITFLLFRVIPGDPATLAAGFGSSTEQIEALRKQMGLDKPIQVQYAHYVEGLAHLDFGRSVRTARSVRTDLATFLPATFELVLISFTVYLLVAISLGVWTAVHRGRVGDGAVRGVSMVSSGIPVFWLAMMLQVVFFGMLGILPLGGRIDIRESPPPDLTGFYTIDSLAAGDVSLFWSVIRHLILPVTAIVLTMLAVGLRTTRTSTVEELSSHYVRSARAKGVSEGKVLRRHVIRNAANPVISTSGLQFGYLLSWIILVETVFQWPGIGLYAFNAFQSLDYAPIAALTLVISFFFIITNLVTDLLYPIFDPRLRR